MAKAVPAKKTCFVISPIGDPGTTIRERADTFPKYIVKRVLDKPHAEEAQAQLAEQVKAVLAGATTDNPISAALQLLQFEKSEDPTQQGIGQILAELAAIREVLVPVIDTGETLKARLNRAIGLSP